MWVKFLAWRPAPHGGHQGGKDLYGDLLGLQVLRKTGNRRRGKPLMHLNARLHSPRRSRRVAVLASYRARIGPKCGEQTCARRRVARQTVVKSRLPVTPEWLSIRTTFQF